MEQMTRRMLLVHTARGVAALSGVTALVARATGVAASTDNGKDRRDHARRHERHDHHHHRHGRER